MRVYINNLAHRDTRTIRYQPTEEVDDMATGVLEGPPFSPTKYASFAKKVQTIIPGHHVVIPRSLYRSLVLVELRGALIDFLVAGHVEDVLLPFYIRVDEDIQTSDMEEKESQPSGLDTSTVPPSRIRGTSFAPPSPGVVGSSMPHMPISDVSSSDSYEHDDERTDDITPAQQLGFGHRVGKKTSRFTPSYWR
ncbi:hypothetical protein M9H77_21799 [Catharanthus roseus]|uniref:Uncharacterized protein n=1 Tax=Catharanthus roseus TaxID=4058 RepID=A0ACC0ASM3_CATRO|nr:hypothetical protein M9H77_21799 [Catharanthus roseus]